MKKFTKIILAGVLFWLVGMAQIHAQANLSVQGSIQDDDGSAVDNGAYDITFNLYLLETGGTAIWTETQSVQLKNGVYSVLLGSVTPLTVPFDQTYYLGIKLPGAAELIPRSRLTSSPYALSLIGQSNIFPSTGTVGVGNSTVTQGKIAVEGSSNAEIEFKKGANTASITYDGTNINIENLNLVFTAGINLPAGQTVKYNGLSDWRLIDVDDFETSTEGWKSYSQLSNTNINGTPIQIVYDANDVQKGHALGLTDNYSSYGVVKKLIDLTGIPHTAVKIKCTIYCTGTPGVSPTYEYVFAGVVPTLTSTAYKTLWYDSFNSNSNNQGYHFYNGTVPTRAIHLGESHEFVIPTDQNSIVFFVNGSFDQIPTDESFLVDDVEIWVK